MTTAELCKHMSFVLDGVAHINSKDIRLCYVPHLPVIDWLGPDLMMTLLRNLNKRPNLQGKRREILIDAIRGIAKNGSVILKI